MTVLDDAAALLVDIAENLGASPLDLVQLLENQPGGVELLAVFADQAQPTDEAVGLFVDFTEEFVLSAINDEGQIDPDNVERLADDIEGGAATVIGAVLTLAAVTETATAGQVDETQAQLAQAVAGLGIDDVTGFELTRRMEEGLTPAMDRKVRADARSKQVDLNDRVEEGLRTKDSDTGWLPDVAEYGIQPSDESTLETVAINDMEFEELIETPAELGLVVPDRILQAELDRSGYAEPTKDFLQQTNDRIRRSARVYQELIRTEDLVSALDTLVEDEELSPQEAVNLFPDDTEVDQQALRERFRLLQQPPTGAPSRSQVESSFARGYTNRSTLEARLDRLSYDVDEYGDVVRATVLDELDGDLQEAVALGLVSEGRFSDLAEFAGVDDQAIELLLQGASFGDIASRRLAQTDTGGDRGLRTLSGIGESRAALLRDVGLETVAELAQADPQELAQAAGLAVETADRLITRAQARVSQGSL
jgi:hypothetical protein